MFGMNKTFADRLNATKSVFQKALEDARNLRTEMSTKIEEKNAQIESIRAEISEIDSIKEDASKFISSLEGLV